jgi:hypothetical protein
VVVVVVIVPFEDVVPVLVVVVVLILIVVVVVVIVIDTIVAVVVVVVIVVIVSFVLSLLSLLPLLSLLSSWLLLLLFTQLCLDVATLNIWSFPVRFHHMVCFPIFAAVPIKVHSHRTHAEPGFSLAPLRPSDSPLLLQCCSFLMHKNKCIKHFYQVI